MKRSLFLSFILASLTFASFAQARQYIQCSTYGEGTDVAVINLTTPQEGTLFLSSGMQNSDDERILVKIKRNPVQTEQNKTSFVVVDEAGTGSVSIPSSVLGQNSDRLTATISFGSYSFEYYCFSRIYTNESK